MKILVIVLCLLLLQGCYKDEGYQFEGNQVFFVQWIPGEDKKLPIVDADPVTFEVLGDDGLHWAKDKNRAYYRGIPQNHLSIKTFKALSSLYATDGEKVVCGFDLVEGADADSFVPLIDNGHKSGYEYSKDKENAYSCKGYGGVLRLDIRSTKSLKAIHNNYLLSPHEVFWGSSRLPEVNAKTFKALNRNYSTDGINVYFRSEIIKGADAMSFEVVDGFSAKDKNHRYEFEKRIE